jgi:hypothetical protein
MGMTIDDAISAIEMGQTQLEITNQPRSISLDTAISIMRKYKKITEIVMNGDDTHYKLLMQIKEVVEDGNN